MGESDEELTEAIDTIEELIRQGCISRRMGNAEVYESGWLSTYADAMRLLQDHGRMKLTVNSGRNTKGTFISDG